MKSDMNIQHIGLDETANVANSEQLVIIDVLSQLAVLAAAPVDCGMLHRRIPGGLACYAGAYAG